MTQELANIFDERALTAFENAASTLSGGQLPILKFQKGGWYLGQNNDEIPLGTQLAVNMMQAEWGWVKWKDQKPVERRMVLIASGAQPANREELGANDKELWDLDDRGDPRDPWQKMIELPVRELKGEMRELVLSGGSRGHEGACKTLLSEFGKGMRQNAGKTPIIELRGDKYVHPKFGITHVPLMPLVAWLDLSKPQVAAKKSKF